MSGAHIGTRDSRNTRCDRIAKKIADILFQPLRGSSYQLNLDDILSIINRICRDPRCPAAPMKHWGSIIAAMFSMFSLLTVIGVRGSELQRQCKQAITCSLVDYGDDSALVIGNSSSNKKLLDDIIPHVSRRGDEWICDCRVLRLDFDNGHSRNICKVYEDLHRGSLANKYLIL